MAEFVTRKENQRRLFIVIICIIADTLALLVGIYAIKGTSDVYEKRDNPNAVINLRRQVAEKRDSNRQLVLWYEDFSREIGWRTVSRGTTDRASTTGLAGEQLNAFLAFWEDELFSRYGISWAKDEAKTLTRLFDKLEEKELALKAQIEELNNETKRLLEADVKERDEIGEADKAVLEEIDREQTGLKEEYKRLLDRYMKNERQHALEMDGDGTPLNRGLAGQVFDKQNELTQIRNKAVAVKAEMTAAHKELENRIDRIIYREEEARERKEPDGELLAVDGGRAVGFIDLLHGDRVFRGTRFKVYSLEKGGVKVDKGEVEVLDVGKENFSRVAVYDKNPDDPIKPGDRIYDERYERGKARYIAIAGRLTGKLSNDEAVKQIKQFGDVYQERVDERTNYVVVGEGYEEDVNFKLALEWGVKFLIERTFYDYVGVP
ncbi:MAG: hypothetical protein HY716_04515 [Planctomycetes bacterium]|nr:hypothetical protein [Planctomycetota bacterium]